MDSIVNRLTEIEDAAAAIVQHAEEQKEELDREYEQKRKAFDAKLEEKTAARIRSIREQLEQNTSKVLDCQSGQSGAAIEALQKEYDQRHTEYAREILRRITEV